MSNRKVSTDALETLGTIIDDTQKRDAIHLAVLPMVAMEDLPPGEDIGLVAGGAASYAKKKLGIVDPFLKEGPLRGERFWMVLYPRMVTSLRHVWTHPAFADNDAPAPSNSLTPSKATSEAWLRAFCGGADCPGYETVIAAAANNDNEEYLHFDGSDAHGEIPPEFWDHMEVVTGKKMTKRPASFSCSC